MKHISDTLIPVKLMLAVLSLGLYACSSDDSEEQPTRSISVRVYESIMPKGDADYTPREWHYSSTMLFSTPANNISSTQSQLDNGVVQLRDGSTLKASYISKNGVITGATYGTYTLLVLCNANPFNAYLENRYTYKQLEYNSSCSNYKTDCLFVWSDMSTHKGYSEWQIP